MAAIFDEEALRHALDELPELHRGAFAAACAERLFPRYQAFAKQTGRGDAAALGRVLSRLWDDLGGNPMGSAELESSIKTCMSLIPREEEGPWVQGQAAAEDAGAALGYALRCRQSGRAQEAAWAARRVYEALDHHVISSEKIDVNVKGAEARVIAHPMVQAELSRQQRDLEELSGSGDPHGVTERLRARATAEGAAQFG